MSRKKFILASTVSFSYIAVATLFSGCGSSAPPPSTEKVVEENLEDIAEEHTTMLEDISESEAETKGERDNSPNVLVPKADGVEVTECDAVIIDSSNVSDGYIIVDYKGSNDSPKLQIAGPTGTAYNYDLHGGQEVFNFTQGDGAYKVGVFEHIGDGKYAQVTGCNVDIKVSNEFLPYLYPNQYVTFDKNYNVVSLGSDLAYPANNDLDVVANVYNYIIENITYDTDLATNVTSDYLPDPDRTLQLKTGICFDYAAVMASMLRSQGIPTRMEIGYAADAYHAWISTYIEDVGWVNGIVEFTGTEWKLMDPTLASSQGETKLRSFIGDGSNYVVCYEY